MCRLRTPRFDTELIHQVRRYWRKLGCFRSRIIYKNARMRSSNTLGEDLSWKNVGHHSTHRDQMAISYGGRKFTRLWTQNHMRNSDLRFDFFVARTNLTILEQKLGVQSVTNETASQSPTLLRNTRLKVSLTQLNTEAAIEKGSS